jgi:hypothetical protein
VLEDDMPTTWKSSSLEKRLIAYAASAAAAGVSLLALAPHADAEIVYTPANIPIPINDSTSVPLDLNNDGVVDFYFLDWYFLEAGTFGRELLVEPGHRQNRVGMVASQGFKCAAAIPYGAKIGGSSPFQQGKGKLILALSTGSGDEWTFGNFCPWLGTHQAYLGLKFDVGGTIHYGWAELRVEDLQRDNGTATIIGYAYETVDNKPIEAGRTSDEEKTGRSTMPIPATLGVLALGAPALPVWR